LGGVGGGAGWVEKGCPNRVENAFEFYSFFEFSFLKNQMSSFASQLSCEFSIFSFLIRNHLFLGCSRGHWTGKKKDKRDIKKQSSEKHNWTDSSNHNNNNKMGKAVAR
jgi:hypothetical protein